VSSPSVFLAVVGEGGFSVQVGEFVVHVFEGEGAGTFGGGEGYGCGAGGGLVGVACGDDGPGFVSFVEGEMTFLRSFTVIQNFLPVNLKSADEDSIRKEEREFESREGDRYLCVGIFAVSV